MTAAVRDYLRRQSSLRSLLREGTERSSLRSLVGKKETSTAVEPERSEPKASGVKAGGWHRRVESPAPFPGHGDE